MTMEQESKQDALEIFFDDNFVPHAFLDSLFLSSLPSRTIKANPSVRSLQTLQTKCSSLLAHLDYYTNELTDDLESKIEDLQQSSSVISYSYKRRTDVPQKGSDLNGVTRLEYYIDTLSSSINSLFQDLESVNLKLTEIQNESSSKTTLADLAKLVTVKKRMNLVLTVFQTANAIIHTSSLVQENSSSSVKAAPTGGDDDDMGIPVSVEAFESSLNILEETIIEEFQREKQADEINSSLIGKCDSMIELLPIFKSLTHFAAPYAGFVKFLEAEKAKYLN
ncbi:unnamed protein product [Kuraishia capsulata CBS 1993]|uniref:Uncharacterized protein n=1 Tax=Kuraishia capsulata CBS 1993 TaxID=1382522 RepID=W6MJM2_9ASCO|nr:uncharacterized protein KUCA_T00002453001 [Kuraishia capsulata CBS 1993]CDK26481.1 unnamed protein product [Kuraishia capsulata CBS 1993]